MLRTPKGWTGPHDVDGKLVEGTHRAHQVPLSGVRDNPEHLRLLEEWLRSYRPDELFDDDGRLIDDVARLAPTGDRRLGATPYANGGRLLRPLPRPPLEPYVLDIERPGATIHPTTQVLGEYMRDVYLADRRNDGSGTFRLFCPDETASNKLDAVFEVTEISSEIPARPQ